MTDLELLSPAGDLSTGIAAIDCGADAVYLGGPSFGARKDAGNTVHDIGKLCSYAHHFGARVYVTVNTILRDDEIPKAADLMEECAAVGVDAFIVQDLSLLEVVSSRGIKVPLHASTQCAVRTVPDALFYEGLGFSRLVLERELSLEDIRRISSSVGCEIEFFVHGALCVCYSGQCYLSEYLTGRSANRGECVQACRSRYDLLDAQGKVLLKDKALLSLSDFNLLSRLGDLAGSGVCSFKIEGRLKNISYVRNVVRRYSTALDDLVGKNPHTYRRASFGRVVSSFTPDLSKTFNRGYTTLYLDGTRDNGPWSCMDSARSIGERIGTVGEVRHMGRETLVRVDGMKSDLTLTNGDGFCVLAADSVIGFRGDRCGGREIRTRRVDGLEAGMPLFRNYSILFERAIASDPGRRLLSAEVRLDIAKGPGDGQYEISAVARREDGEVVRIKRVGCYDRARDPQRMRETIRHQLSKESSLISFTLMEITVGEGVDVPFMPTGEINALRRDLASRFDALPIRAREILRIAPFPGGYVPHRDFPGGEASYKFNVSNALSRAIYGKAGAVSVEDAYELTHRPGAELMRTRYCIRHELGMCLRDGGCTYRGKLYLRNNARLLELGFDCGRCEMSVKEGGGKSR